MTWAAAGPRRRALVVRLLRLRHRVGFRGVTLLFFAVLDTAYGLSLAVPSEAARESATLRWLQQVAPLPVWAALWLAVAAVCGWYAFRLRDRVAFGAAALIKCGWGLVMAGGWAFGDVERGWVAAMIWLVMAGWVTHTAHWPEPPGPGAA